jgi:hypothetical protein
VRQPRHDIRRKEFLHGVVLDDFVHVHVAKFSLALGFQKG